MQRLKRLTIQAGGIITLCSLAIAKQFHVLPLSYLFLHSIVLISCGYYLIHLYSIKAGSSHLPAPVDTFVINTIYIESIQESQQQCTTVVQDLNQFQCLLHEAIDTFIESFQQMHHGIQRQKELSGKINSLDHQGNVQHSFMEFVGKTQDTLTTFVDYTVQNSKIAMEIVDNVEIASDKVNKISSVLDKLEIITKKTNILAINASIEAARAGEAGKGFDVVANEVRTLSKRIEEFSQDIRSQITEVVSSIQNTEQSVHAIASKDMTFALSSKKQVDDALVELGALNKLMESIVIHQSLIADQVAGHVNKAITALQFQDIVNQSLEHNTKRLYAIEHVLGTICSQFSKQKNLYSDDELFMQSIKEKLTFLQELALKNPVKQQSIDDGAVELF